MNPSDASSFNHRTEKLSTGRTYHFVDQIPTDYKQGRTPTLLCVHGFPDCWYGWRYQIKPWVQRGFRVVTPDIRVRTILSYTRQGYGGTDKPKDAIDYSTKRLCADLTAILDLLSIKKAVLIGHDWGHSLPPFGISHIICAIYATFTAVHTSEKLLKDSAKFKLSGLLRGTTLYGGGRVKCDLSSPSPTQRFKISQLYKGPEVLSKVRVPDSDIVLNAEELGFYTRLFEHQGMNGPLNYYRTALYRHEEELAAHLPPNVRPDLPVLFIYGTKDTTTTAALISKAHRFIPRLQDLALEERGHWVMLEARDVITDKVIQWLEDLIEAQKARL
ncbi:hypothetical protein D9757_014280 [Collybiopsis confluens]|uniref:AB hydrolase-1 domain-containing protein n=1 Tax=Collybiopsis confluens TaxID=2823264 RepID=A0A8H5CQI5_9AGAR|nr:hypothetical protein D9757_014280 [Collybiopsis confluens]